MKKRGLLLGLIGLILLLTLTFISAVQYDSFGNQLVGEVRMDSKIRSYGGGFHEDHRYEPCLTLVEIDGKLSGLGSGGATGNWENNWGASGKPDPFESIRLHCTNNYHTSGGKQNREVNLRFKITSELSEGAINKEDWDNYAIKIGYKVTRKSYTCFEGDASAPWGVEILWSPISYQYISISDYMNYGDWANNHSIISGEIVLAEINAVPSVPAYPPPGITWGGYCHKIDIHWSDEYELVIPNEDYGGYLDLSFSPKKRAYTIRGFTPYEDLRCKFSSDTDGLNVFGKLITWDDKDNEILIIEDTFNIKEIGSEGEHNYILEIKGPWSGEDSVLRNIIESKKVECRAVVYKTDKEKSKEFTSSKLKVGSCLHIEGTGKLRFIYSTHDSYSFKESIAFAEESATKIYTFQPFKKNTIKFSHWLDLKQFEDEPKNKFWTKARSSCGLGDVHNYLSDKPGKSYSGTGFTLIGKDSKGDFPHLIGHAFCGLQDESEYSPATISNIRKIKILKVLVFPSPVTIAQEIRWKGKNCAQYVPPHWKGGIEQPYYSGYVLGCMDGNSINNKTARPTHTSVMRDKNVNYFNRISCGYCLNRIHVSKMEERFGWNTFYSIEYCWIKCKDLKTPY